MEELIPDKDAVRTIKFRILSENGIFKRFKSNTNGLAASVKAFRGVSSTINKMERLYIISTEIVITEIAAGAFFSGFSVSAMARPIIPVPVYENMTIIIDAKIPLTPFGIKLCIEANGLFTLYGLKWATPNTVSIPSTMNKIRATTFTEASTLDSA